MNVKCREENRTGETIRMNTERKRNIHTTVITQIALMAALQCIISPFALTFPFSPVPVSLATLMLYLSVYILGKKNAVISCGIYLLIGLVGLPVFSGFTGGIGKVLGPTGGYMLGYLFLVYITGVVVDKWSGAGNYINYLMQGFGMFLGTAVCYLFGSLWLAYQSQMSVGTALMTGAFPFIPGDLVKIIIGVLVGNNIRKRMLKAGVL